MKPAHRVMSAAIAGAMALAIAPQASADPLPTHGVFGPHLDSAPIPGWPVPPVFPPPPAGVVVPGDGVPPDPEYHVLGPALTVHVVGGVDTVASPGGWHWEQLIDFNPYLGAAGDPAVGAVVPTVIIPIGGPPVAFLMPIVAGPDLYIDVHQPDDVELGAFTKTLISLMPFPVAWGTSVMEDPGLLLGAGQVRKEFKTVDGQPLAIIEESGVRKPFNAWQMEFINNQLVITQRHIPEPGTLALLASGLTLFALRRRIRYT